VFITPIMPVPTPYDNIKLRYTSIMNIYYGLRHGESEANIRKIIVSLPQNGVAGFGLTPKGATQVVTSCRQNNLIAPIIISSDFKRTRESAELAAHHYNTTYVLNHLLRERGFGAFELLSNSNYHAVWQHDMLGNELSGVETTASVAQRCNELITHLEQKYSGKDVLLVSHGDTLQIMQTIFKDMPPAKHRELAHFHPGELRRLTT